MPYVNVEKQKEFQRKWVAAKARAVFEREQAKLPEAFRGLKKKFTTWEQLEDTNTKVGNYAACVIEAKKLIIPQQTDKLRVAALALRACRIVHGGDRRAPNWETAHTNKPTLARFAKDCGANKKTLWTWVTVYAFLKDVVGKDLPLDFTAGFLTVRSGKRTLETYLGFLKPDSPKRRTYNTLRIIGSAHYAVTKYGVKHWSEAQATNAQGCLEEMLKIVCERHSTKKE